MEAVVRSAMLILVVGLMASGCKTTGSVPLEEARRFRGQVRTIALGDPGQRLGLLSVACGDLPSCAADCREAFRAFASLEEPTRSEKMLQTCFDFDRYAKDADVTQLPERAEHWIQLELRHYAARAARVLGEGGKKLLKRLDRALAGLPAFID